MTATSPEYMRYGRVNYGTDSMILSINIKYPLSKQNQAGN